MATAIVALGDSAWHDSGGAAGSTVLLECDAPTDSRNRKRPAARWHLAASAPASGAASHALWASDWRRGTGAVRLEIPTGESLWLRREAASVAVLITPVG